ncbi:ciliary microtubule-associated protein 2-like [Tachysurus vachellii]|uniref:ciliary microtubule-associated protein 2-like n=1 Tax=Tachysurus vachellii TaxID=175792 RepID=UPI00296ABFD9|nr:ciliary microtubule-associated protein 2-like [Tachysurus vachellii]
MDEIRFQGAPFGTRSARFEVNSANKRMGTDTQLPYYKRMVSDWNTKVGPGTYRIPSFTEELEKKPGSLRGICETREKRFKDCQSSTPGPGTYGKGGIPSAALEEKERMSVGTCPSMGHADQNRFHTNTVDSSLGPGIYNLKSSTELILSRRVSKRSPYDLSTGNGNIFTHPKWVSPDPGTYPKELPKFGKELQKPEKKKHGVFGSREQYPATPTERIYLSTLSQFPRAATSPGPGWYNVIPITSTYRLGSGKQAPFLSTAPRMSKKTQMLINKNHNPVGPGRYNIAELILSKNKNSHISSFMSGTQRYLHCPKRDKYIQERLRPINVPLDRSLLIQPGNHFI